VPAIKRRQFGTIAANWWQTKTNFWHKVARTNDHWHRRQPRDNHSGYLFVSRDDLYVWLSLACLMICVGGIIWILFSI
jgi:hypothetical protein